MINAGLIWVGPKPESIRAMGLKDAAKKLMAEAGVPVTPGYLGEDQDPKTLKKEAGKIGYPVLIKAVAGGGGKGMRRVDRAEDFDDALDSCKREAASSFGDDRVILEKYIDSPRHIEVQVFGDSHGNVVHLFERDCSLQRRHQKVIEEAPAPGMDAATREAVCGAAVRAAQAVNYEGAGTVEFIADARDGLKPDRIWFMEMNTRLQVEHPVTEEITGRIWSNGSCAWRRASGCRSAGEAQDHRPRDRGAALRRGPGEGVPAERRAARAFRSRARRAGSKPGSRRATRSRLIYDPMIAKLVAHGGDREEAIGRLAAMLDGVEVWPVRTNAGFLFNALAAPGFRGGDIDTGFIERNLDELVPDPEPDDALWRGAAAVATARPRGREPLADLAGFRMNAAPSRVAWRSAGRRIPQRRDGRRAADGGGVGLSRRRAGGRLLRRPGDRIRARPRAAAAAAHGVHDGEIVAPMPGRVTAVEVAEGDKVAKGQRLLTLEAMKMEHALIAPFDGTVAELSAEAGRAGQRRRGAGPRSRLNQVPNDGLRAQAPDDHRAPCLVLHAASR